MSGLAVAAVLALGIGSLLWWHSDAPKTTNIAYYFVGIAIALGALFGFVSRLFSFGVNLVGGATGNWTGITGPLLALLLAVLLNMEGLVYGCGIPRPRRAKPKKYHPPICLLAPIAATVAGVPLLGALYEGLGQFGASVGAQFG